MFVYSIIFEDDGQVIRCFTVASENGVIDSFVKDFVQKEKVKDSITLWVCYDEAPEYVIPFCYSEYYDEWRIMAWT